MNQMLAGRTVLITQAAQFMGPALCEVFAEQGAVVIASEGPAHVIRAVGEQPDVAGAGGGIEIAGGDSAGLG